MIQVTDQCPIQVMVHQLMLWILYARLTKIALSVQEWNTEKCVSENLSNTNMVKKMVTNIAKTTKVLVEGHCANVIWLLLKLT
jgi:hypothetical protein